MRVPALLLLATVSTGVHAATFQVGNTADIPDIAPGDGFCTVVANPDDPTDPAICTLRAAIMEANASPNQDTIILEPGATYLVSIPGAEEDNAASGDLDILYPVIIRVPEAGGVSVGYATIQVVERVDAAFDILNVPAPGVTLSGLRIRGGDHQGSPWNRAGGINVWSSHVRLRYLDVDSEAGDGVFSAQGSASRVTSISHSTISGATNAVSVVNSRVDIVSSTLAGATNSGLYVQQPQSQVLVVESTISGNFDGVSVVFGARVDIVESTIADNTRAGIWINGSQSTASAIRSLFASNGHSNDRACWLGDQNPTVTMEDNIYDDHSCPQGGEGDDSLFDTPVYLSLLGDHGGPTPTHRPMTVSPAVDAYIGTECVQGDEDQRGMPRAVAWLGGEPACDIGAVELEEDVIFFDQVDRL